MSARHTALLLRLLPPARRAPSRPACVNMVGRAPVIRRANTVVVPAGALGLSGVAPVRV